MINLDIDHRFQAKVELSLLERAAQTTLQQQATGTNPELTIVVTSDELIHELNRQYRDIDSPTDVLSFPGDFIDPDSQAKYLGDVIISFPRAAEQAQKMGHRIEDELQLLVIHGVLHLLGHDHAEAAEKIEMWKAQDEILNRLGIQNLSVEGDE